MTAFPHWTKSLAAVPLLVAASTAGGQGVSGMGVPSAAVVGSAAAPAAGPAPTGVASPRARIAPMPSPAAAPGQFAPGGFAQSAPAAPPVRSLPTVKPFQMDFQRPTVSPYLQLHREDLDDSLPNYFAFVLPQIQQQQLLRQQQTELQKIQLRLQQTGHQAPPAAASSGGGAQPASYHARFLNTGGYFSGVTPHPQSTDASR